MTTVRNEPLVGVNLTTTSYLVLGLVALSGPTTPYDLKRFVSRSIGYFWTFPHSQLYTEPERLAEAGLLAEERESAGRRRRTFAITPAGRDALHEWLATPQFKATEIRDLGLLQLFFGGLVESSAVTELARAQLGAHRTRLAEYEGIAVDQAETPEMTYPLTTLRLGLAFERAALAFWQSIVESPPQSR